MPRACNLCADQDRARIEAALAKGATFVSVSRETRFSQFYPDSIERHWRNHVAPSVRESRQGIGLSPGSIAVALLELVTAAREIQIEARSKGNNATALRAISVEKDLHSDLLDRLGVPIGQAREEVRELVALRAAVDAVAESYPQAAELVAERLDLEEPEAAQRLRDLFPETTRKEIA